MLELRKSLGAVGVASLVLLFGVAGCSTSLPPANSLTGPLGFTVDGSGGGSGPIVVGGSQGGAGVGIKIILADVSLVDACVSGASITCAPSGQRVEIDIAHLGAIPLGMPLDIATGVDVLRQNVVGGASCSSILGTAVSGSVTITSSDGQHIAGNFSVTMKAPDGSTSTLSGTFDVNFCQALVPGGGTTGGTSSGGTTTGGTTSGSSSSGGQTSGGSSSGTTSGGSSGTGGSSGGTTGGSPCAPGATWQGDFCTVTSCVSQPDQGACTVDGGLGQCFGGACVPPIDLTSDPSNCGFYGASCPVGTSCTGGICSGPNSNCDGAQCAHSGDICVSNPRDGNTGLCIPDGCGSTDGIVCQGTNGLGSCCGGSCWDTAGDPVNCGGCGVLCGTGNTCRAGRCQQVPDCTTAAAGTRCEASGTAAMECCGGACIDVSADFDNCGGCGVHCPQNGSCFGSCYTPTPGCANLTCDAGLSCASDVCVLPNCGPTTDGLACAFLDAPGTGVCCGSSCLDLLHDPGNCGACGRTCGAGTQCSNGECLPPLSFDCTQNPGATAIGSAGTEPLCCGGVAVDAYSDTQNCSACGYGCAAGVACQGYCRLPNGNFSQCDGNNPCPAGTTCVQGSCVGSTCSAPQEGAPCVLLGAGPPVAGICCAGTCVDWATDSSNCQLCAQSCPTGSTCQGAACFNTATGAFQPCVAGGCAAGFNCSGNFCIPVDCTGHGDRDVCSYGPGLTGTCCNGACVDLRQAGNCSACGSDCPSKICSPSCLTLPTPDCEFSCPANAICVLGQCVDGFCRGSGTSCAMANGAVGTCCGDSACADLASDPDSCGSCDVHCPAGQTCSGGVCSGGDAQCTGRAGGYCKLAAVGSGVCCGGGCIDVQTDAKNCGACGVDCGASPCASGVCGG